MDERFLELSENMVDRERDAAVKRAASELRPSGRTKCIDCGSMIEPARLAVAPFATRCIECQQEHEFDLRLRKPRRTIGIQSPETLKAGKRRF